MSEQVQPTDEEIFLAWRKVINRDRSALRHLTDKLALADRQRSELRAENAKLRAELDAVPVDAILFMINPWRRDFSQADIDMHWQKLDAWAKEKEQQAVSA